MTTKLILHLLILQSLTFFLGCKNAGIDSEQNLELKNTVWQLQSFETEQAGVTHIQDGRVYSITFLPDTIAEVRADCNTCTATYRLVIPESDNRLALTLRACTEVYCGPESLDQLFLEGLRNATTFEIKGDLLRIYYNHKRNVLNFKPSS
jgi:heat shock protein HslJ